MNITDRLYLGIIISIILMVGLFSVNLVTSNTIAKESKKNELVHHLHIAMSRLDMVTYEYLLHHEKRMEQQWNSKYNSTEEILEEIEEVTEELMKSIRANYTDLNDLFSQVIVNYEKKQKLIEEGASQEKIEVNTLLEQRLVTQLLIKSQSLVTDISRFEQKLTTEAKEFQELADNLILIVIIILAVIITTTSLLVANSISKPLDKLIEGVEIVGKGNLKHKIDIESEDEIGKLATSFNQMTAELEKIYPILKERIKELNVIYETSKIMEETNDFEKAFNRIIKTISTGYQFPKLACVRITYNGKEYQTTNFKETEWKQAAIIKLDGKETSTVEVFYLEKKPFLIEEEKMIKEVASQIGNISERKKAMEQLAKHGEELEKEVKKRTKELEEAKNRSEVLLTSIGDGVFAINMERNIIHFNKAAEKFSGYKASDVVGKPYYDVLHFVKEKDRSENIGFIRRALKGESTDMTDETILLRKDGSELPVADSASPMKDKKGEVIGVIVVFRDASKERKIQQMRSEFMSLATHELKNPLTIIRGYIDELKDERAGPLTKEQRRLINITMNASDGLLKLANELLNVSRLEEGRVKTEPLMVDPIDLAEKAITTELRQAFKQKKQKFTFKKPQNLPKIKIDPKFIMTPIQNLLSNASKYTPEKGKIEFEVSENKGRILFRITDSGVGIPKEEQFKLFQRFFRGSNTVRMEKGTGLGLYMTKLMIELSGGRIWFESEEKKGSTFYFTLPIKT